MTICIATPEYGSFAGGIATFYENLASIFVEAGHTIIILTVDTENSNSSDQVEKKNNIVIITLRQSYRELYNKYKKNAAKDSLDVVSVLATGIAMKNWLSANHKNYAIDIIETVEVNGLGYFLTDQKFPPVVVCAHGALFQLAKYDFTLFDKRYRIITSLEKRSLLNADLVITHSPLNQLSLEKECKIKSRFATAPWQEQLRETTYNKKYDFLVVGRLQTCKGVKVIADALQKSKDIGQELKIVWIGSDTYTAPYGSSWSKFLRRKYASIWQRNFVWMPEIPKHELRKIIASAGIIIIPSVWETFNYIAIEALSAGRPIIISLGAGAAYLFENNNAAIVVPGNDSDAILKGIYHFLSDISFKKNILDDGNLMKQRLSPEVVLKERIQCYIEAFNKRTNRINFEQDNLLFQKKIYNLKLPVSYYIRKTVLKILAKL